MKKDYFILTQKQEEDIMNIRVNVMDIVMTVHQNL